MTDPKPHPLAPLIDTVRWPTPAESEALRELHRILGDCVPGLLALKENSERATDQE
jgi:hypothetical protein